MATRSPLAETAKKTLFGLFVFCAIVLGWWHFQDDIARRTPLPGVAGPNGACSVWFAGSSTIHRWKSMAQDMAPWRTHNRGVEGAMVEDIATRLRNEQVADAPAIIVFYVGENDIAHGASAEQASAGVTRMVAEMERKLPGIRTVVLGLKPSPTRWSQRAEQLRYNAMIADFAKTRRATTFADFGNTLLVDGKPGPYYDDSGVHLNPRGYRLWGDAVKDVLQGLPGAAACAAGPAASD